MVRKGTNDVNYFIADKRLGIFFKSHVINEFVVEAKEDRKF